MSGQPIIRAFFDEPTKTVSYLVADPMTKKAAIIDSVFDYDHSGEVDTRTVEAMLKAAEEAAVQRKSRAWNNASDHHSQCDGPKAFSSAVEFSAIVTRKFRAGCGPRAATPPSWCTRGQGARRRRSRAL